MLNSTLLEILRTFSKEEFKKFEDFIKSPYYNKNSNLVKLFDALKRYFPEFTNGNLKRELVWNVLFPVKDFNYGVMKNLIYEFQKLSEKFLHLQNYETNKFEQSINLLNMLKSRHLFQVYQKYLKLSKSEIDNSQVSLDYFYYKYMIEVKEQSYLYIRNKTKNDSYGIADLVNENLQAFFFTNYFSENYNSVHEAKFYNKNIDTRSLENILNFFENSRVRNNDFVLMYYYCLKTVLDERDNYSYAELKKLLFANFRKLSSEASFNFGMALINFCSINIMKGSGNYLPEQFEVYKFMIENGFYKIASDKYINPWFYSNVVSTSCKLKQFDWAVKFISDYKSKLNPEHQKQYFSLANVVLNLNVKNYNEALRHLSEFKDSNVIDKITIKRFQIIIYYESGFLNELHSLIDASKHFISNDKKVNDSAKNIFNNFLYFVQRLTDIKSKVKTKKENESALTSLRNEIQQKDVTNKIWLLEKADELLKG